MSLIRPGIRRLFRLALGRRTRSAEIDEEIALHLELRTEQLEAAGLSPEAARAEALRRFGPPGQSRRNLKAAARHRDRTMRRRDRIADLLQDYRHVLRGLRLDPRFTAFTVATLALGIGVNAALFGVVDRMLLRGPAHVADWREVKRLYLTADVEGRGAFTTGRFGYVVYRLLGGATTEFSVAAYTIRPESATFGRGTDARLLSTAGATADLFPLLGTAPALGRFFTGEEDRPGAAAQVAVISDRLWRREFAADPGVVGQPIVLSDRPYTVIGVAPPGFTGPELRPVDVWFPMSLVSEGITPDWPTAWNAEWLRVVIRPRPGVSPARVEAVATTALRQGYTGTDPEIRTARLTPLPLIYDENGAEPQEVAVSRWLIAVSLLLLLVAGANVTNLLLARAAQRRRELAVRLAMGVGRGRLARTFLMESVTLAAGGALAGLAVAWALGQYVRRTLLPNVDWTGAPVDGRMLLLSALAALVIGLIVGLAPAARFSRPDLTAALKAGAREGGGRISRTRTMLTMAQAALSVVLLVGSGLFLKSLANIRRLDLGIQPDRLLVIQARWPAVPGLDSIERARRKAFYPGVLDDVRGLPGVEHASLTVGLPFQFGFGVAVRVPGWDSLGRLGPLPRVSAIASDYFATTGTPLLRGRAFSAADRDGSEPVAIVSATMASTLWPGGDPIGQCIYVGDSDTAPPCSRIVGIAGDARRSRLRERPGMHYYLPFGQERGFGGTSLLVRPAGDPERAAASLRRALVAADPTIGYVDVRLLQDAVDPQIRPWRLGASIFTLMGGLTLLVAALGLYSLISYLVAWRTRELGVRRALGATGWRIARLVVRGAVGAALGGTVVGVGLALAAGRWVAPLLFDTAPTDPAVFGTVVALLLAVAVLAALGPALRAGRASPIQSLRAE